MFDLGGAVFQYEAVLAAVYLAVRHGQLSRTGYEQHWTEPSGQSAAFGSQGAAVELYGRCVTRTDGQLAES
ncbi:hypothetical protein GCM10009804_73900 [Kribbella hippodromi]|uniref:Uncharacterized protein n=1 Tax=Kribbella hippodromi TaxID=434347 RepID=A0ABN2EGT1_9ACTN